MMRAAHMERPHTRNQGRGKEEKVQKGFLLFGPLKVHVYCAFAAVAWSRLPSSIPLCVRARVCAQVRPCHRDHVCVCARKRERERDCVCQYVPLRERVSCHLYSRAMRTLRARFCLLRSLISR